MLPNFERIEDRQRKCGVDAMTVREQRGLRGVRHSGVGDSKPNIPDVGYDCAGRASGLGDLDGVAKRHDRDVVAGNERQLRPA